MNRLIALAIVLFATCARAVTANPSPCTPIQLSDPQGRPIPNAIVTVLNTNGTVPPPFFYDLNGTQPFTSGSKLVSSQILQLFGTPGTYSTNVSGAGISKVFDIICTQGVGPGTGTISIDRTADLLTPSTINSPGLLTCPGDDFSPCTYDLIPGQDQWLYFDFIMPSTPLTFSSLLLSMFAPSPGSTNFIICGCSYATGDPRCSVSGGVCSAAKIGFVSNSRSDIVFSSSDWLPSWAPNDHVHVVIMYVGSQSVIGHVFFENVRLELNR